jgi:hypothetical protein
MPPSLLKQQSLSGQGLSLLQECGELCFLAADPIGDEALVGSAREGSRLLHELPDVISDQGNTRVDLNEIRWVGHELSLSLIWIALRPAILSAKVRRTTVAD